MLTLYRRHKESCKNAAERYAKKDRCPVWAEGTVEGKYVRRSLKTRSWERGEELKRQLEAAKTKTEPATIITLAHAIAAFIQECESRNLNPSTLRKYRTLSERMGDYAQSKGIAELANFGPDAAREFRNSWKLSPRTASKQIERLRSFFNFCVENEWIAKNPAKSIKPPEVRPNPTLPFTEKEVSGILVNTDFRSATFFKVLLNSGLRIIDAAMMRPERIQDGKLFLYQQKTGVPVWVPLPPDLIADLSKLSLTGGFYFVIESDRPTTVAEYYRVKLEKAAIAAGLAKKKEPRPVRTKRDYRPHRFRDTFAVNLLQAGVPIEEVSTLLGHTDIKTTQQHYAPWVKSRQDRLEELVSRTWKQPKLVRVK